jgi:hypothetical protein
MNKFTKSNLKGSGTDDKPFFKGVEYQKGYGLGDQFRRFFRWIVPIFKKHAAPTIEKSLKKIGEESINSISNIAKDVISGKNFSESAKENISNSIDYLKQAAEATLKEEGVKRKRKESKILFFKKNSKKIKDIFS